MNGEPDPRSRIRLCGGLEVRIDGRDVAAAVPAGQCRTLLTYLVLSRGRAVSRDKLVDAIWRDDPPGDPQAVLSTLLSRLRAAIAPAEVGTRGPVALELPGPVWVDVEEAQAELAAARAAAAREDWPSASARAQAVADRLAPGLLPARQEPWVEARRRELDDVAHAALELVATSGLHVGSGGFGAEQAARALVDRAPFRESGYRLLMELLARRGDAAEALRVYDDLRRALRDELGTVPSGTVQALHRDLLAAAPADDARAEHDVPRDATSFVGRAEEVAWLVEQLREPGALTITGTGGMGKTRVALRAAHAVARDLRHGSWLVELAALAEPGLVGPATAAALGVRLAPGDDAAAAIAAALGERSMCVVLDNCEHVVAAAAELTSRLAAACPHLRILATSREPLGFPGERSWALPPLSGADQLALFAERARAAAPDFRLEDQHDEIVERLCARLDGMPLAIELAAALVRSLDVHAIEARLDERFRLTMRGPAAAPERQQTLHALVAWSDELLTEPERLVLRRLGVFRGGFGLDAAEAVCDGDVVGPMVALVAKSLVTKSELEGRARYHLLETIRQYAEKRLDEAGERAGAEARHRAFYAELAEATEAELAGPSQGGALDRVEADLGNFRAAMARALAEGDPRQEALRIAGALFGLWYVRGRSAEGRRWLEEAAAATREPSALRAKALQTAGELAREQGDLARARELLEEGVEVAAAAGVEGTFSGTAYGLFNLGLAAAERGDLPAAGELLERSLAVLGGDRSGPFRREWPLLRLGQLALDEGDTDRARDLMEESLGLHRRCGDGEGVTRALDWLARAALARGEPDAARMLAEEALHVARELDYVEGVWGPLHTLARLAAQAGETERAARLCDEALRASVRIGSRGGIAASLECAATLADPARAVRMLAAAETLRAETGPVLPEHARSDRDATLATARSALEPSVARAAWTAGTVMSADDAVRLIADA
ncbi:MAG TPA: BTAD domain-containing putative transcriptional regulator [Solirubrobacteraceae bacterium]